jgi:hypothetical protein
VKRQRVEDLAVLHSSCCGIDVHQKSISACVLTVDGAGKLTSEVRQFGTTTHELRALNDWLAQCAVTHVAMESTGVYWNPRIISRRSEQLSLRSPCAVSPHRLRTPAP